MKKRTYISFLVSYKFIVLGFCFSLIGIRYAFGQVWFSRGTTLDVIEDALSRKNPDARNKEGVTGLMFAADQGFYDRAELFLNQGARINLRSNNKYHMSALHFGVFNADNDQSLNVAKLLLDEHADVRAKGSVVGHDVLNAEPWHFLVNIDSQRAMEKLGKLLVQNGANVNAQTKNGYTLLHLLVEINNEDVVRFILKQFGSLIDMDVKKDGQTALQYAHKLQFLDVLSAFDEVRVAPIIYNVDQPNTFDPNGFDPLMVAIIRDEAKEVERLLQLGVHRKSATRDEYENSPLQIAILHRKLNMVRLLLKYNADITYKNAKNSTVLHYLSRVYDRALQRGIIDALLATEKGRNDVGRILDVQNNRGDTFMHIAVEVSDEYVTQRFLTEFPNMNLTLKNKRRANPIELAHRWKRQKMMNVFDTWKRNMAQQTQNALNERVFGPMRSIMFSMN